jgi:hypothetical protein
MTINTSGGSDEMGESALRRSFNDRTDSSNDLISASIACCKPSQEFECIRKWYGIQDRVTVPKGEQRGIGSSLSAYLRCFPTAFALDETIFIHRVQTKQLGSTLAHPGHQILCSEITK